MRCAKGVDAVAALSYQARMTRLSHLWQRLIYRVTEPLKEARFRRSITHVHGPHDLDVAPDDVVLLALVHNGAYYLDVFFDHYRAMGVKHFVFLDNGSTDDTVARIKAEPGTIIDHCPLPLGAFEHMMRGHMAQTYGQNRWCLYIDMDEILDFEGREQHGIQGLTRYMAAQGHTAMMAQMLEMFPKAPLAEVAELPFDQVQSVFSYYDTSTLSRFGYHAADNPLADLLLDNEVTNPEIDFLFGGVRGKVFGENCCLTKHPLIFNGPDVTPAPHPHLSKGVRCSDVTVVLKHYKFANDPGARDAATVAGAVIGHGEDEMRASRMTAEPALTLFSLDARPWNRVALLRRAGFLQGSEAYDQTVNGPS